jgi:peptidoglycan/LPS O-acetylase OafA/YrhL
MRDRSHSAVLEGARGVAVGGIVAYHALRLLMSRHGDNWGDISPAWWWVGTFRFGVDAFFVLAGYLIVGSWRSCRARASSAFAAVRQFLARRAWRILPPYLAMLAVVVPALNPGLLRPEGWRDLLRFLTLQQYLDVHLPATVNVPTWSLTTEVHFYLAVPVVAWLVHRLGGWRSWLLAVAIGAWWVEGTARGDLAASLLPGRLDDFVLGASAAGVMARVAAGGTSRWVRVLTSRAALPLLAIGLLAVGTYHGATYQREVEGLLPHLVHPASALLLGGLLLRLVAGAPVALLRRPSLVWLGGISFSLYLWHYPIIEQGLRLTGAREAPAPQSALTVAVLVGLAVLVAIASQRLVEAPAERHRSRSRAPHPTPTAAPARTPVPALAGLPVVEAELGLQHVQEVARAEGHQPGGAWGGGADDGVALPQLAQVAAVHAQGGGSVALHRQP